MAKGARDPAFFFKGHPSLGSWRLPRDAGPICLCCIGHPCRTRTVASTAHTAGLGSEVTQRGATRRGAGHLGNEWAPGAHNRGRLFDPVDHSHQGECLSCGLWFLDVVCAVAHGNAGGVCLC